MASYKLYTDGSYQENLGIAAIGGYLLAPNGDEVFRFSEKISDPNDFKYHETLAMLHGLNKALENGITELECFSDDKSISNTFNKEKFNKKESDTILNNPYKSKIALLMEHFSYIKFNYLPREFNHTADKLAGKHLKIHKEDNLKFKKRKDFIGQEDKLLHVPNLLCEEDFQENNNTHEFSLKRKSLVNHYLMDISRGEDITTKNLIIKCYFIERNPKNHKDIKSTLLSTDEIEQKHLFVKGMERLTNIFQQSEIEGDIGLMFNATNILRHIEMILRRRSTLHHANTDLIKNFVSSTAKFSTICLHNDEKLIKNHQLLINNENLSQKNKIKL